jgi:hypothetical protein
MHEKHVLLVIKGVKARILKTRERNKELKNGKRRLEESLCLQGKNLL